MMRVSKGDVRTGRLHNTRCRRVAEMFLRKLGVVGVREREPTRTSAKLTSDRLGSVGGHGSQQGSDLVRAKSIVYGDYQDPVKASAVETRSQGSSQESDASDALDPLTC